MDLRKFNTENFIRMKSYTDVSNFATMFERFNVNTNYNLLQKYLTTKEVRERKNLSFFNILESKKIESQDRIISETLHNSEEFDSLTGDITSTPDLGNEAIELLRQMMNESKKKFLQMYFDAYMSPKMSDSEWRLGPTTGVVMDNATPDEMGTIKNGQMFTRTSFALPYIKKIFNNGNINLKIDKPDIIELNYADNLYKEIIINEEIIETIIENKIEITPIKINVKTKENLEIIEPFSDPRAALKIDEIEESTIVRKITIPASEFEFLLLDIKEHQEEIIIDDEHIDILSNFIVINSKNDIEIKIYGKKVKVRTHYSTAYVGSDYERLPSTSQTYLGGAETDILYHVSLNISEAEQHSISKKQQQEARDWWYIFINDEKLENFEKIETDIDVENFFVIDEEESYYNDLKKIRNRDKYINILNLNYDSIISNKISFVDYNYIKEVKYDETLRKFWGHANKGTQDTFIRFYPASIGELETKLFELDDDGSYEVTVRKNLIYDKDPTMGFIVPKNDNYLYIFGETRKNNVDLDLKIILIKNKDKKFIKTISKNKYDREKTNNINAKKLETNLSFDVLDEFYSRKPNVLENSMKLNFEEYMEGKITLLNIFDSYYIEPESEDEEFDFFKDFNEKTAIIEEKRNNYIEYVRTYESYALLYNFVPCDTRWLMISLSDLTNGEIKNESELEGYRIYIKVLRTSELGLINDKHECKDRNIIQVYPISYDLIDNPNDVIIEKKEYYSSLFFPPYKIGIDSTVGTPTSIMKDIYEQKPDASFNLDTFMLRKEGFTYRGPGFKAINDYIQFLQWVTEGCTGIVSTYLTEWDLSLYMQEHLFSYTPAGHVKKVYLNHRVRDDNPISSEKNYFNSKALCFNVAGSAVSKLFFDNEKLWRPSDHPMSTWWTPQIQGRDWNMRKFIISDAESGESINSNAVSWGDQPFIIRYMDIYDTVHAAFPYEYKDNLLDIIRQQDHLGTILGHHPNFNLKYYQAFYTTSGDYLTNYDITFHSMIRETAGCEHGAAAEHNLGMDDFLALAKEEMLANGGYFGQPAAAGWGDGLPGRHAIQDALQDDSGDGSEECAKKQRKEDKKERKNKANETLNNTDLDVIGDPGQSAAEAMLADEFNNDASMATKFPGINRFAPALFGGPHGANYSPNTIQGYFERENIFLRNIPRLSGNESNTEENAIFFTSSNVEDEFSNVDNCYELSFTTLDESKQKVTIGNSFNSNLKVLTQGINSFFIGYNAGQKEQSDFIEGSVAFNTSFEEEERTYEARMAQYYSDAQRRQKYLFFKNTFSTIARIFKTIADAEKKIKNRMKNLWGDTDWIIQTAIIAICGPIVLGSLLPILPFIWPLIIGGAVVHGTSQKLSSVLRSGTLYDDKYNPYSLNGQEFPEPIKPREPKKYNYHFPTHTVQRLPITYSGEVKMVDRVINRTESPWTDSDWWYEYTSYLNVTHTSEYEPDENGNMVYVTRVPMPVRWGTYMYRAVDPYNNHIFHDMPDAAWRITLHTMYSADETEAFHNWANSTLMKEEGYGIAQRFRDKIGMYHFVLHFEDPEKEHEFMKYILDYDINLDHDKNTNKKRVSMIFCEGNSSGGGPHSIFRAECEVLNYQDVIERWEYKERLLLGPVRTLQSIEYFDIPFINVDLSNVDFFEDGLDEEILTNKTKTGLHVPLHIQDMTETRKSSLYCDHIIQKFKEPSFWDETEYAGEIITHEQSFLAKVASSAADIFTKLTGLGSGGWGPQGDGVVPNSPQNANAQFAATITAPLRSNQEANIGVTWSGLGNRLIRGVGLLSTLQGVYPRVEDKSHPIGMPQDSWGDVTYDGEYAKTTDYKYYLQLLMGNETCEDIPIRNLPFQTKSIIPSSLNRDLDVISNLTNAQYTRHDMSPELKNSIMNLYLRAKFYSPQQFQATFISLDYPIRNLVSIIAGQISSFEFLRDLVKRIDFNTLHYALFECVDKAVIKANGMEDTGEFIAVDYEHVLYNYWTECAVDLFGLQDDLDRTKNEILEAIKSKISILNSILEDSVKKVNGQDVETLGLISYCYKDVDEWSYNDVKEIFNLINLTKETTKVSIIDEFLFAYLNILYNYRFFFVAKRFNKEDGTMWIMRCLESIMDMVCNESVGDGRAPDILKLFNKNPIYRVAFFELQNSTEAKRHAVLTNAGLEDDRINKLYIKIKWVNEDVYTKYKTENPNGNNYVKIMKKVKGKKGRQKFKAKYAHKPEDGLYQLFSQEYTENEKNITWNRLNTDKRARPIKDFDTLKLNIEWGDNIGQTPIRWDVFGNVNTSNLLEYSKAQLAPEELVCLVEQGADFWTVEIPQSIWPRAEGYKKKLKIKRIEERESPEFEPPTDSMVSLLGPMAHTIYPITNKQEAPTPGIGLDNIPALNKELNSDLYNS